MEQQLIPTCAKKWATPPSTPPSPAPAMYSSKNLRRMRATPIHLLPLFIFVTFVHRSRGSIVFHHPLPRPGVVEMYLLRNPSSPSCSVWFNVLSVSILSPASRYNTPMRLRLILLVLFIAALGCAVPPALTPTPTRLPVTPASLPLSQTPAAQVTSPQATAYVPWATAPAAADRPPHRHPPALRAGRVLRPAQRAEIHPARGQLPPTGRPGEPCRTISAG